jgi:hypothetical protein
MVSNGFANDANDEKVLGVWQGGSRRPGAIFQSVDRDGDIAIHPIINSLKPFGIWCDNGRAFLCRSEQRVASAVQPCNRAFVNVTIKLDDSLCREARHRAVDADTSLSGWIADLIRERLGLAPAFTRPGKSLLEMLGDEKAGGIELECPPLVEKPRPAGLED